MAKFVLQLFPFFFAVLVAVQTAEVADDVFAKFHQKDYKIRFDRSILRWYDENYYKSFAVKTFKYNRTQAVTNLTYEYKVDLGYDLLCLAQVYKFYSNEYRVFPIRLQINFCSVIDYNIGGVGKAHLKDNPPCPLRKGVFYGVTNFFPDESLMPPLLPSGEFMAEITMFYKNKNISTFATYAMVYRPILPKD